MAEGNAQRIYPAHAVAIVGVAGRFPGAEDLTQFWHNVREGVESLDTYSEADLEGAGVPQELRSNPNFVRKGTTLHGADLFDSTFFGFSPREAQIIDPQHRLFLECAWEAMEHAGYIPAASEDAVVGVYAGASINTYLLAQILRDKQLIEKVGPYQIMLGNDKDFLCTRVSYKLDLRGPSMTIQTACSTSLVAVEVACRALHRHECDMALAGGVSLNFPERTGYLYEEGMIFSPDGHCRPFDAEARGTRAGAGAGIVVLKRLKDAVTDRDTIHAIILGSAINNDGSGKAGYTAPSVDGQIEVIATAQALADVDPRTISYVEAHGTATPLGDPIEIAALSEVFRASTPDVGFCNLGSLKANLGHLDAAAGVAGLIKTVLALKHREIPPLVNFRSPNPQLKLESSPFCASNQRRAWDSDVTPRRAGVSSFGIGGTNAHVVLEEAPPTVPVRSPRDAHVFVLSGKTVTAVERIASRLADHLDAQADISMTDVEWTLQAGRTAFTHRRIAVASDAVQAANILRQPARAGLTSIHEGGDRPVAFLFSGQGSQHVGSGRRIYRTEPVYRDAFDRCAALFEPHLGVDIREIISGKFGEEAINETRLAQPILFATAYALASMWMKWGITPKSMLGHSIGEYVAAHLAGVMSLEDAVSIVAMRGRLMQAMPHGSMAAVSLSAAELQPWLNDRVEIAAINAPSLCAVSGAPDAIADLIRALEARDIGVRPLYTSHAFHSAMMEPVLEPFSQALSRFSFASPRIPYISNLTGDWITAEQATSLAYYTAHLRRTVQFEAGIRRLAADPALFFLEVGPGVTLTALTRATLEKERAKHVASSLPHPGEDRPDDHAVLETLGRLWLSGISVDWREFHSDAAPRRVPLPTYPFERKRHWVEAVQDQPALQTPIRVADSIDEWFYAPSWIRGTALSGTRAHVEGIWLMIGQPGALLNETAMRFREAGASPIIVRPAKSFRRVDEWTFELRPEIADDFSELVLELRGLRSALSGAVILAGSFGDDATAEASLGCYGPLVALAEGVQDVASQSSFLIIVANEGSESVLDEAITNADKALTLGPVLTLPMELPGLRMRVVDLEKADGAIDLGRAARALVEEASTADGESVVARRGGRRWLKRIERLTVPAAAVESLPLKKRGLYLITGGTGGIGLTLARWLATEQSARLLLTSRSPFPPREEWDALLAGDSLDQRRRTVLAELREIERAGGAILTACADAADAAAMTRAIGEARGRWGEIDGVIHAAGTGGTGSIAFLKSPEDVRAVFAPKVGGLKVLTELLGGTPLDFVVLMSSINAVLSAPGLSDYSAANAYLDAFVESDARPRAWRRVIAMDWGAWQGVGMAANRVVTEAQRKEWEAYLKSSIKPSEGIQAFARALASGQNRLVITPFDLAAAFERVRAHIEASIVERPSHAPQRQDTHSSRDLQVDAGKLAKHVEGMTTGRVEEIVRAHPAVNDATVVLQPVGSGTSRPVIYVSYHPGEELTASEVRAELKGKVSDENMPSVVVTVDASLHSAGRIDLENIPNPFEDSITRSGLEELATAMERSLAQIWQDVLGVEQVNAEDNFFELGGNSLLSVRVTSRVLKDTGFRMDARSLFFQNLRQIAAGIEAKVIN